MLFDLRNKKTINLNECTSLKDNRTYKYTDSLFGKELIVKIISNFDGDVFTSEGFYITEFKKLILLSSEPEIGTVYFLVKAELDQNLEDAYIMDFINGETLGNFLDSNETLSFEKCFDLIFQIASGMEKAHHHEIYHNDLHLGNIMLDNLEYIKIIDFNWSDYKRGENDINELDLKSFKSILIRIKENCISSDIEKFNLIYKYLDDITSFKNVNKFLKGLHEIAFDISFLDKDKLVILSSILNENLDGYKLNQGIQDSIKVPNKFLSQLTESQLKNAESNKNGKGLSYIDTHHHEIDKKINATFWSILYPFKQANLLDWKVTIVNEGADFFGPYKINYWISLTPKLLRWKSIHQEYSFLPKLKGDETIHGLILDL